MHFSRMALTLAAGQAAVPRPAHQALYGVTRAVIRKQVTQDTGEPDHRSLANSDAVRLGETHERERRAVVRCSCGKEHGAY